MKYKPVLSRFFCGSKSKCRLILRIVVVNSRMAFMIICEFVAETMHFKIF